MRLGRSLIALATGLVCGSAYAGPALAIIPFIAGAAGATVFVQAVIAVGIAIGSAVYGASQQRKAARRAAQKAKDDYNASLQDRMITGVSTEYPYRYVYGRAKVGSSIIAIFTSGDKDEYKHLVCVHAAHQCDAIEEIYIAGEPLGTLDFGTGDVLAGKYRKNTREAVTTEYFSLLQTCTLIHTPVNPTTGPPVPIIGRAWSGIIASYVKEDGVTELINYTVSGNVVTLEYVPQYIVAISYTYMQTASTVRVKKHLGTPGDTVDSTLNSELPALWPFTSVVAGFCYTVIRLDLNQPEFQTGTPTIEVLIRGKKVYDPRSGTTYWSQNPALCLYDYLRSPLCGVDTNDIPTADVITAANVCDTAETFGARYTMNGVVFSDSSQADVLDQMADAMAGTIVPTTWAMTAGSYVAPVVTLNQSDIVGALSVNPGPSNTNKFNGVKGQFTGPETLYISTDYKPYQNATYRATDGLDVFINQSFPFTDSIQRVHNLARILTEDSRNAYTIKAEFSMKAWGLKVGDRVLFTSAFLGITSKPFRITDKSYKPAAPVELTLKEDAASIWDYADTVLADDTPNTTLPDPFKVNALTGLYAASGDDELYIVSDGSVITRVRVWWPISTTQSVVNGGNIEIEWQETGTSSWLRAVTDGRSTSIYITEVKDGRVYILRARAINPYLNAKSDWMYTAHQVIGKLNPPPDVISFRVTENPNFARYYTWQYTANAPKDLAGFLVRYSAGFDERSWESSVPLFEAGALDRSHSTSMPGDGEWSFLIRAIDTSGNLSVNTVRMTMFFDAGVFAVAIDAVSADALGWPGTCVGGGIDGYALVDSGVLTWDTIPTTWDGWADWAGLSIGTLSYEHPVYDLGAVIDVVLRENHVAAGATVAECCYSSDNVSYTAWAAIPSAQINTRYLKFRWTVTGASPVLYRAGFNLYDPT